MSLHFVQRRRIRLAYERRGSGPLVVLVQGIGLDGRMWIGLPGALLKSGFCVITPDTRGTGYSDTPLPPYRMRDLADDLADVIRHAREGPAIVVGLSLGGMIAQHLALRSPKLVRGLVLAATTCGLPHGRQANLHALALIFRTLGGDERVKQQVARLLVHRRSLEKNPRIFSSWIEQIQRSPRQPRGMLGQLLAAVGHSTGFSLHRITCPTVVLAGDDDRVIPPDNASIIARRIPGAELVMLPDAGHVFPLEVPAALPDAIKQVQQRALAAR